MRLYSYFIFHDRAATGERTNMSKHFAENKAEYYPVTYSPISSIQC